MNSQEEITAYKRVLLASRLQHLTREEIDLFNKIWPVGVSNKDLDGALALCDRTLDEKAGMSD